MAAQLPAKLKTNADIARFAQRAAQLEKLKPAIAYWCEYWIVNQLLARGLHNSDAECLTYTTKLMDKLEETKTKHANDDDIVDDTAGQACVEQFGLETFERAERAVQANKVTKQTADTFLAAATFLELVNIWGAPDDETLSKIRYAKWNAVRIVKAIKEGKDPNESNPVAEPEPEDQGPALDPNDPEVQALGGGHQYPPAPTVQDVSDEHDDETSHLAAQSHLDRSLHPSAQPSGHQTPDVPAPPSHHPRADSPYEVSPIEPSPQASVRGRNNSVGGGYFPSVLTHDEPASPPSVAADVPTHLPPAAPSSTTTAGSPPPRQASSAFNAPAIQTVSAPVAAPLPAQYGHQPQGDTHRNFVPDDVAIAKAQKHARWAISALNFEDSETAIRELRAALQTLGDSSCQ